jgi:uncharacterized protein (TIGR02099 family)
MPRSRPGGGRLRRLVRAGAPWSLALLLVLLAGYAVGGRLLMARLDEQAPRIVALLEEALGLEVSLGAVEGRFLGWDPVVEARSVALAPPGAPPALTIERLRLDLDVFETLLRRHPVASALVIDELDVRLARRADGVWGLRDGRGGALPAPASIVRFLYHSDYVDLRGARAELHAGDGVPDRVELEGGVLNERFVHRSHLRVRYLPGAVGPNETGTAAVGEAYLDLTGDPLDPGDRAGRVLVRLDDVALTPLAALLGDRTRASGMFQRLELRADFDPDTGVRLRAAATARALDLGTEAPLRVRSTRLVAESAGMDRGRGDVLFRELRTVVGDEDIDLDGLRLAWRPAGTEEADRRWFGSLPPFDGRSAVRLLLSLELLGERPTRWLANLDPDAETVGTRLFYDEAADVFATAVEFEDLRVRGYQGVPTVRGVDASLVTFEGGARLLLDTGPFYLHFPKLFDAGWQYDGGRGRVDVRWGEEGLEVLGTGLRARGEAGRAAGAFALELPREAEERSFSLLLGVRDSDARHTAAYLPKGLDAGLRDWIEAAARSGRVPAGAVLVHGRIVDPAPVERSVGLYFDVEGGRLAFDPAWPPLTDVDGWLRVDHRGVRGAARRGRIKRLDLEDVALAVPLAAGPDGERPPPRLELTTRGSGDGAALLDFLRRAPLGDATAVLEAPWEAEGAVDLTAELVLPLAGGAQGRAPQRLEIEARPALDRLRVPRAGLVLRELAGTVRYVHPGRFSGEELTASLFDGPVRGRLKGDLADGGLRFEAEGTADASALASWLALPLLGELSGRAPWEGRLRLAPDGGVDLSVRVPDATALRTGLPEPLAAPGGSLAVDLALPAEAAGIAEVSWEALGGRFRFTDGRLEAGALGLRDPLPELPEAGLRIRGRLPSLEVGAWLRALGVPDAEGAAGTAARGEAVLLDADLVVDAARWGDTAFGPAELLLSGSTVAPVVEFDAPRIAGRVEVDPRRPLRVAIVRLDLPLDPGLRAPEDAGRRARAGWFDDLDPRVLPTMDVSLAGLSLDGAPLGSARFRLEPDPGGLRLAEVDARLRGLVLGAGAAGPAEVDLRLGTDPRTRVAGRVTGDDLGTVLEAWGFAPVIESERFAFEGALAWAGPPDAFAAPALEGALDLQIERGRFVQIEAGAAPLRMIGLLNFAAIARRMRLDFTDLYKRGLAYDKIEGRLAFGDGALRTEQPVEILAPSSSVSVDGTVDLAARTLDGSMIVTLPVSRNLPWAAASAALLANPLTGAGVLVAERIFREQIDRFSSARYRIGGTLQAPEVEFVTIFENETSPASSPSGAAQPGSGVPANGGPEPGPAESGPAESGPAEPGAAAPDEARTSPDAPAAVPDPAAPAPPATDAEPAAPSPPQQESPLGSRPDHRPSTAPGAR